MHAIKQVIVPAILATLLHPCMAAVAAGPRATTGPATLEQRRETLRQARESQFRHADADGNRRLSPTEIEQGSLPRVLLRRFEEIDLDGDGELSPAELQQLTDQRMRAAMQPAAAAAGKE